MREQMGWRERDWAKLDDDELLALYGVERRAPALSPVPAVRHTPYLRRRVTTRTVVWSLVGCLVTAFALAVSEARHQRLHVLPPSGGQAVLYGVAGTLGVCTEEQVVLGNWRCTVWTANVGHLPVAAPRAYAGSCAHARVDQESGAWICVSGVPDPPGT